MKSEHIRTFIMAGKALFTLESSTTGVRYTYKVTKLKRANVWFVHLLTGPDNENSYAYLAYFNDDIKLKLSNKSKLNWESKPVQAFDYLLRHIDAVPDKLKVYHSCKCGRCGRTLTTPESIERGIGPECYKRGAA